MAIDFALKRTRSPFRLPVVSADRYLNEAPRRLRAGAQDGIRTREQRLLANLRPPLAVLLRLAYSRPMW